MLLLYLVILRGCLVCEEIAVDPRKVNPDRTCSQAGLVLVGGSPWYVMSGPHSNQPSPGSAFSSLSLGLSLLFHREAEGYKSERGRTGA